jgi:hypothetical protein
MRETAFLWQRNGVLLIDFLGISVNDFCISVYALSEDRNRLMIKTTKKNETENSFDGPCGNDDECCSSSTN